MDGVGDAAGGTGARYERGYLPEDVTGPRTRLRALRRFFVVLWRFLPLAWALLRDRRRYVLVGGRRDVDAETQRRRAEFLLEAFLDLGPAFIKLGQLLSTRPDVLPQVYVAVLSQLQDRVPPDDWAAVRPVVESEVGPVAETFDDFDTEPISGASLGQVYTARLDGERVAVKVLRPGVRRRVEADLRVIAAVLPWVVRFAPPAQAFTLENLAEEFAASIREEMDYAHEAATLATIRENFADAPRVRVPDHYPEYSTDRVLTMEYVDGTKITDVEELDRRGIDREDLVERLERAYIRMIVEDGVFHADPHPGNLAVQDDGTVVFYDFGMSGRLDERTRDRLFQFYVAVAEEDVDAIMDAFVALDALDPDVDRDLLRGVFELVLEEFRGADRDYDLTEVVEEFEAEMYEFPMRLPRNLALVVRVSTVLEGVCRTLDPGFDFIAVISEYVRERRGGEVGERAREYAVERAREVGEATLALTPRLLATLGRLDEDALEVRLRLGDDRGLFRRLATRLVLGALVAVTLLVASALYAYAGARPALAAGAGGAALAAVLAWSFRREDRGFRGRPQFTRQSMRERRGEE